MTLRCLLNLWRFITRSAVSQGIRRLEDGFQTLLVMRTTRSVRLTE
ncbi:LysR family transcriptional regulator, partial [Klebsiella pneumoniae]|nr:LysR family transcriptional regulator [Klebsiella pneumoniae]